MNEIFFDYLKEKDRVVVENNETRAKVVAVRNGKKVANSSNGCFKSKIPAVVLVVSRFRDVEIFQLNKNCNTNELDVARTFYGKVPFRERVQLENFYVMHCISVHPYRKFLERLFEEAGGNRKFTKEEIAAFVRQFNARHRISAPVQSAA